MCKSCWWGDRGAPIINTPEVLATAELIRRLYEDLRCLTGGPLHWMLDDMNIDDEQVEGADLDEICGYLFDGTFERRAQAGADTSDERKNAIKDTCGLILASFLQMPESHRAAAIAWHEGWAAQAVNELAEIGTATRATPEQVDELVTQLRQAEDTPTGPKECVPVPCPSFEPCDLQGSPIPAESATDSPPIPSGRPMTFKWSEATVGAPDPEFTRRLASICRQLGLLAENPAVHLLLPFGSFPDEPAQP